MRKIKKGRASPDMLPGVIHQTKFSGPIEIIEYTDNLNVSVKFLNTGTTKMCTSGNIRCGGVRDPYSPTFNGVGFIGEGKHRMRRKERGVRRVCDIWSGMLARCYSKKSKDYKYYGGKGVTVCEEWHNYQNFAEWYITNYPDDGADYEIDKDDLSDGVGVYSPETCRLVTHSENSSLALGKTHKITNTKTGRSIITHCLAKFCSENDFEYQDFHHAKRQGRKTKNGFIVELMD